MIYLLLNSIALDPHRWTAQKIPYFQIRDLLHPVAEAGFSMLEVWQYHVSRESETVIRELRKLGDSLELSFPVVGFYPKLHLSGAERQQELELFDRITRYAKILGAKIIKIFAGIKGTDQLEETEYDRSLVFLAGMIDTAEKNGLLVTSELHKKTLLDSLDAAQKLLRQINSSNFKICFQPFDFRSTEKAVRDYLALAEQVPHVHYQGRHNGKMELLNNSDIDYAVLTRALVEHGFEGYISIEFVRDCVVESPEQFDLQVVLANARCDKSYIGEVLCDNGVEYSG
ncbi:MAG: sugar phosphate isomerase/epimerase [Fidelibacterota bacterium]|nr:MAG: sugar phosphate isomerase/epimerase [Candidatus Neomarinimicrobiota bacterium]